MTPLILKMVNTLGPTTTFLKCHSSGEHRLSPSLRNAISIWCVFGLMSAIIFY